LQSKGKSGRPPGGKKMGVGCGKKIQKGEKKMWKFGTRKKKGGAKGL